MDVLSESRFHLLLMLMASLLAGTNVSAHHVPSVCNDPDPPQYCDACFEDPFSPECGCWTPQHTQAGGVCTCVLDPGGTACACQEAPTSLDCICGLDPTVPGCACHLDPASVACACEENPASLACVCDADPSWADCPCLADPSAPECFLSVAEARSLAIRWLESHQSADGSWGEGVFQPLATSEALLGLVQAGRAEGSAARKAVGRLLNQEPTATDLRARSIRALRAAGVPQDNEIAELTGGFLAEAPGSGGWGATARSDRPGALDTALVLDACRDELPAQMSSDATGSILARQRADSGWAGDGVVEGSSDRVTTADVLRALIGFVPDTLSAFQDGYDHIGTSPPGEPASSSTSTLEVAARLAAIHMRSNASTSYTNSDLELELRSKLRIDTQGAWGSDPYVHALVLLALNSHPTAGFDVLCEGQTGDDDCDGVANELDLFPFDPNEQLDSDLDGIGDNADPDRDGDGYADADDAFPDDPNAFTDVDGDGLVDGSAADQDSDGDSISDLDELLAGTDPYGDDSDGDGILEPGDPCPLALAGSDADGDGVCSTIDECEGMADFYDVLNADGDALCDRADPDDDDDGFGDRAELALGTDPRDASDLPVDDPLGDFDRDRLTNSDETGAGTDRFSPDSDSDGHSDYDELALGTDPLDALDQPGFQPAVFSAVGGASTGPSGLHLTGTGGEPTPVASSSGMAPYTTVGGDVSIFPGFQAQASLGMDLDGDLLSGFAESALGTSVLSVDTDADGFVDGPGGAVLAGLGLRNLDGDGYADGEQDFGTDPTDSQDRPGKPGDVAPLGHPDGKLDAADGLVLLRLIREPALLDPLDVPNREIAEEAADPDSDGIGTDDGLWILRVIRGEE